MKSLCYINGRIQLTDEGAIGINDLALQRAYGVFDFGRTYNGKLFHFERNLKRFRNSASEILLEVPDSDEKIREVSDELIEGSDLKTPSIRLLLTGGYSEDLSEPNFIIIAEELPIYSEKIFEGGIAVVTAEYQRELPEIKSINYLNAIRTARLRREKEVFDTLYHSKVGITECPRNNFFAFLGDILVTPKDHVLHGVTRGVVMELASGHFSIEERAVGIDEIGSFDEAFTTSTIKRVLPITKIDDSSIGTGSVGERTSKLMRLFDEYTEAY